MSNLPPGTSEWMIPGNRPEDEEWDGMCEWACEELAKADLTVEECRRAITAGIAGVLATRELISGEINGRIADARMEWEESEESDG